MLYPRRVISVVDMHTGGEPVRIITSGYPPIAGDTILDKRRFVSEHLDHLRRLVILEPRGHYDMYGVLPVEADHPEVDMAVLFLHNEGYSTMCGHATIALGRYAVDADIVAATAPVTTFTLQVPSGTVSVSVDVADGQTGAARYVSMPSYLAVADAPVDVDGFGSITLDVAFGGAFYALVPAAALGLTMDAGVDVLRAAATRVTAAVTDQVEIRHQASDDLAFLYGTIITDGRQGNTHNVCVFADAQVDRSPTGSGVQARLAAAHARGEAEVGDQWTFRSIVGSVFTGRIVEEVDDGVVVEVGGRAFYTGRSEFVLEEGDELNGFVVS